MLGIKKNLIFFPVNEKKSGKLPKCFLDVELDFIRVGTNYLQMFCEFFVCQKKKEQKNLLFFFIVLKSLKLDFFVK